MPFLNSTDILSAKTKNKFNDGVSLYEIFHENTKLNKFKVNYEGLEIMKALSDNSFVTGSVDSYKMYTSSDRVLFDKNKTEELLKNKDFKNILKTRRTCRGFSGDELQIDELACIIEYSYGINGVLPKMAGRPIQSVRYSPSAGALYPLEIYVIPFNVGSLKNNIYHYNVHDNCLENIGVEIENINITDKITAYASEIKKASCIILITAMFRRSTFKYGDRGYRFIHLDAGHLGQNICLVANAINKNAMLVGGFLDDEVNNLLNIDGLSEGVIYEIAIG